MKITRYEWLHSLSEPELAKALCNILDWDCDGCPATMYCRAKHNGMTEWLSEEITPPAEYQKQRDEALKAVPDVTESLSVVRRKALQKEEAKTWQN